jgi:hypothetical protein
MTRPRAACSRWASDGAEIHLARLDAGGHAGAHFGHALPNVDGRPYCPFGIVLVGDRRPEERQDAVAQVAVEVAASGQHGIGHDAQDSVQVFRRGLGIHPGRARDRRTEIGEEDGQQSRLAWRRRPGPRDPGSDAHAPRAAWRRHGTGPGRPISPLRQAPKPARRWAPRRGLCIRSPVTARCPAPRTSPVQASNPRCRRRGPCR